MQKIIQKKIKMKSDNSCILCTDQKTYKKTSVNVRLTLFKDENNFYEQRKW